MSVGGYLRPSSRVADTRRIGPERCRFPGCVKATRDDKDYCSDHVDRHEYVIAISGKIEAYDAEIKAVADGSWKDVDLTGQVVQEIAGFLRQGGPATPKRIARMCSLDPDVVDRYVTAMLRAGLVRLAGRRSRRPDMDGYFVKVAEPPGRTT